MRGRTTSSVLSKNTLALLCLTLGLVVIGVPKSRADSASPRFMEQLLSEHYEDVGNNTLKYILSETEYKIFVDTVLDPSIDFKALDDKLQIDPFPGTAKMGTPTEEFIGRIEALPQKRNVLLLLSPNVSAEKEALVKEALTGKLRMNLTGGIDNFTLRRSTINVPADNSKSRMPASITNVSEWSLRSIIAIALSILFIMALAAYAYYRIKNNKNPLGNPIEKKKKDDAEAGEATEVSALDSKKDGKLETLNSEWNESPMDMTVPFRVQSPGELIESLRTIATTHNGLVSEALQKLVEDPDNFPRIAAAIELLGYERALDLFRDVPQKVWTSVGQYMAQNPLTPDNPVNLEEVALLYRAILAYIVEHKGFDSRKGISNALNSYSPQTIADALQGEDPGTIAILLSGISQNLAFDIIPHLETSIRTKVLALMAGISSIDSNDVKKVEDHVVKKLMGGGSSVGVLPAQNDARVFASLSQLSSHEEEALFNTMLLADRNMEYRARKHRLYPVHLATIRNDILRDELQALSAEDIARVLRGVDTQAIEKIFALISERKANIARDTLEEMRNQTMSGEFAVARRNFLDSIFQKHIENDPDFADAIFEGADNEKTRRSA